LAAARGMEQLEVALFRKPRSGAPAPQVALPDFPAIRKQLQTHRNLTLQLLWEEYREGNAADGYSYSRSRPAYKLPSAGLSRRCVTPGSSRWQTSTKPSPLLDRLNRRAFRKRRDACRASLFEQLDQPVLRPLPVERYVLAQWKKVRPNIDYHVEIERHYYSVPSQLVGEELEARYTATTVEIFYHGVRVASHRRGLVAHAATTLQTTVPRAIARTWSGPRRG
jgi:hypothetical protein